MLFILGWTAFCRLDTVYKFRRCQVFVARCCPFSARMPYAELAAQSGFEGQGQEGKVTGLFLTPTTDILTHRRADVTKKFDVVEFPSPMELVSMVVSIVPMENLAKLQGGSTTTSDPHWFRKRHLAALLLTSVEDVCKMSFVVGIVRTIGWERISWNTRISCESVRPFWPIQV